MGIDADYGTLLLNEGRDSFSVVPLNGVAVKTRPAIFAGSASPAHKPIF